MLTVTLTLLHSILSHASEFNALPAELKTTVFLNNFHTTSFHSVAEEIRTFTNLYAIAKSLHPLLDINQQIYTNDFKHDPVKLKLLKTCLSKKFDLAYIQQNILESAQEGITEKGNKEDTWSQTNHSTEEHECIVMYKELQKIALATQSATLKQRARSLRENSFIKNLGQSFINMHCHHKGNVTHAQNKDNFIILYNTKTDPCALHALDQWLNPSYMEYTSKGELFHAGLDLCGKMYYAPPNKLVTLINDSDALGAQILPNDDIILMTRRGGLKIYKLKSEGHIDKDFGQDGTVQISLQAHLTTALYTYYMTTLADDTIIIGHNGYQPVYQISPDGKTIKS